jgi:hypothetical protein
MNYYFLGSMDHLLSRPGVVSATNKDSITLSRCTALYEVIKFNQGSWMVAIFTGGLAYLVVLQSYDWDFSRYPDNRDDYIQIALFSGPAVLLSLLAFILPIIMNPYVLGWPFYRRKAPKKKPLLKSNSSRRTIKSSKDGQGGNRFKKDALGRPIVDINTMIDHHKELDREIERAQGKADVELGSLATRELSPGSPGHKRIIALKTAKRGKENGLSQALAGIPEGSGSDHGRSMNNNRRSSN